MAVITPAIAGIARAGATRIGYYGVHPEYIVTSFDVGLGVTLEVPIDRDTWRISERPAGQANTLHIDTVGVVISNGQVVTLGFATILNPLFKGTSVRSTQVRDRLNQGRVVYAIECVSWEHDLGAVLVTKKYTSQSATAIAQDLTSMATGFTSTHVEADLDTIDEIQFTMVPLPSAFQQLANRIGGYWYVDEDKDVHLFTTFDQASPSSLTSSNVHVRSLNYSTDTEGIRNKILVEGKGSTVRAAVAAGSTTIPVDDASMFATSGTNHAKLEAQRITYTGVSGTDGTGSTVEPLLTEPTTGCAPSTITGSNFPAGGTWTWAFTFVDGNGGETMGGPTNTSTNAFGFAVDWQITSIDTGPSGTVARKLYRSKDGGSTLYYVTTIADNTTTTVDDTTPDGSLSAIQIPTQNTSRTPAGSTTIPVHETSVFSASGGWVNIGAQYIRFTGRSVASGVGTLTGVPASGAGAILSVLSTGSEIENAPHLTGIPASGAGAIEHDLTVGEGINILVISEDSSSQTAYGERQHFIQDRRLSLTGCAERGAAHLALVKSARISGSVRSTDPQMRAGAPFTINVTEWGINTTVVVQDVSIVPTKWPHPERQANFSTRSVEDLFSELRAIKERQQIR